MNFKALGQAVECHFYADLPHTFQGQGDREFMQNTLQFFDRYLSETLAARARPPKGTTPARAECNQGPKV